MIYYGRQYIEDDDINAVVDVLKSDNLTRGPRITEFESALCERTDARFAVCLNSGTSALHIACLAAGINHGDEVVTSPNTFVASSNCVLYCGAKPVFADIDSDTYNISPRAIESKITHKTRAIIAVHFAGQSCDMTAIAQIVRTAERKYGHKIYIIEDACHALGSLYKGKKVGSCAFSDMAVMSFHPVKHVTTGEGGVVLTNDDTLKRKLKLLRSHGITDDPHDFVNRDLAFQSNVSGETREVNPWYYDQIDLGFNYRITDIQCALGLSQLKKLDRFRKKRREIVDRYNDVFKDREFIVIPKESKECSSNFHLYVLLFDFEKIGISRAGVMLRLEKEGVKTQVHYIPVYLHSYYRTHFGIHPGDYPHTESYYQRCLTIPLHQGMDVEDVDKVITAVEHVMKKGETN